MLTGTGGGDANGTDGVADMRGADGASVTAVLFGATPGSVGGATPGTYGTLTLNADGSYSYALNNAHGAVQGLDTGETLTEIFNYTITDGDGDTSTTTLTITINGNNDAPVVANTHNWMPTDPAEQNIGAPAYPKGYPLMIAVPTDVDVENLIVTAAAVPPGVFYDNGGGYVPLTAGTVLYDPSLGIDLLDNVVYRPTANVNDTVNVNLVLDVTDGTATVQQTVGIHEVVQNHIPIGSFGTNSGQEPADIRQQSDDNADDQSVAGRLDQQQHRDTNRSA